MLLCQQESARIGQPGSREDKHGCSAGCPPFSFLLSPFSLTRDPSLWDGSVRTHDSSPLSETSESVLRDTYLTLYEILNWVTLIMTINCNKAKVKGWYMFVGTVSEWLPHCDPLFCICSSKSWCGSAPSTKSDAITHLGSACYFFIMGRS